MSKRLDIATEGLRKGRKSIAYLGLRNWLVEALRGYILRLKSIVTTAVKHTTDATTVQLSPVESTTLLVKPSIFTTVKLSRKDSKALIESIAKSTSKQVIPQTTIKLSNNITKISVTENRTTLDITNRNNTLLQLSHIPVTLVKLNT